MSDFGLLKSNFLSELELFGGVLFGLFFTKKISWKQTNKQKKRSVFWDKMDFFFKLNFKFVYALPQGNQLSLSKFCKYDETQHFPESLQGESSRSCSMNHFIIAQCLVTSTCSTSVCRTGFHSPHSYKILT